MIIIKRNGEEKLLRTSPSVLSDNYDAVEAALCTLHFASNIVLIPFSLTYCLAIFHLTTTQMRQ